jgi:hypothetical protein
LNQQSKRATTGIQFSLLLVREITNQKLLWPTIPIQVRLLRGDQLACKAGVTPEECLAIDPHPQCTPFFSVDYCALDESFQTYITARSRFVRDNPEGSHWFHHLENKLAGYKVSAALGLNPPKVYSCSNDIFDLADGFTPPGNDAGFVIRATNQHSSKGVFVFPDGFTGLEKTLGLYMSPADVIADLTALGVTSYIVEEYIPGKGNKTLPMEYKFHMIGGEVASINVVANRGESCACKLYTTWTLLLDLNCAPARF